MKSSAAFADASCQAAQTLDALVACLGTADMDLLKCQLTELARQYGSQLKRVRPEHWKLVSSAIVSALEETLPARMMDNEGRESWETAVESLSAMAVQLAKEQK